MRPTSRRRVNLSALVSRVTNTCFSHIGWPVAREQLANADLDLASELLCAELTQGVADDFFRLSRLGPSAGTRLPAAGRQHPGRRAEKDRLWRPRSGPGRARSTQSLLVEWPLLEGATGWSE